MVLATALAASALPVAATPAPPAGQAMRTSQAAAQPTAASPGDADTRRLLEQLTSEVADLRQKLADARAEMKLLVPVGVIVAFRGTLDQANALRSRGWWVCDGSIVNDPEAGPFNGFPTPDLRDRFVRGATSAGQTGGSPRVSIPALDVDTKANWFAEAHQNFPRLGPAVNEGWGYFHVVTSKGNTTPKDIDYTPMYYAAIYLLKVR